MKSFIALFFLVFTAFAQAENATLAGEESKLLFTLLQKAGATGETNTGYGIIFAKQLKCEVRSDGKNVLPEGTYCRFASQGVSFQLKGKAAWPMYSLLASVGVKETLSTDRKHGTLTVAAFSCRPPWIRFSSVSYPHQCVFNAKDLKKRK